MGKPRLVFLFAVSCFSDAHVVTLEDPPRAPDTAPSAASCLPVDVAPAAVVDPAPVCTAPPSDPFDAEILWQFDLPVAEARTLFNPSVGRVVDIDGDGAVTMADPPTVVTINRQGNPPQATDTLWALHGATGAPLWSRTGIVDEQTPLLVDVDGVPGAEIVVANWAGEIVAIDSTGRDIWTIPAGESVLGPLPLAVLDVDEDGTLELVTDLGIHDLRTGRDVVMFDRRLSRHSSVFLFDVDGDGRRELRAPRASVDPRSGVVTIVLDEDVVALLQADNDPEVELLAIGPRARVMDPGGRVLRSVPDPEAQHGDPGCTGDVDGDGRDDLIAASHMGIFAYHADPLLSWWERPDSQTGPAGCALFDFDRDGKLEIVVPAEREVMVMEGLSGLIVHRFPHIAGTTYETPTIADVDGDGDTEIIAAQMDFDVPRTALLTAWTHRHGGWLGAGSAWTQARFRPNLHDALGGIAPFPTDAASLGLLAAWPSAQGAGDPHRRQFSLALRDACVDTCDPGGVATLSVDLTNHGQAEVKDVTLEVLDERGGLLAERTGLTLPALQRAASVELSLEAHAGPITLRLRVPEDAGEACDALTEALTLELPCP